MTVAELIAELQKLSPDLKVVVPITSTFDTMGSSPATAITSVVAGFDWDASYVHLNSDDKLVRFTDEQFSEFLEMKKQARKVRTATFYKNGGTTMSHEDMINMDTEVGVHPLFRRNKKEIK